MKYLDLIKAERNRQEQTISLIASENYVSRDVLEALGSVLTNKYAEGFPGKRYYAGNGVIDEVENWVKSLALEVFKLNASEWGVNVQPYSGSPANMAIYLGLLHVGDKILSMQLDHGGHLTHGHSVSFSGKLFDFIHYGLDELGNIDYEKLLEIVVKEHPKMIVAGATSYPGEIDFDRIGKIAHQNGALMMADISHLAGLMAMGLVPSCFGSADVVMTTTHKTLRGPRGAMIFAKNELMEKINVAVFPGMQGGPHMNAILAIGVALQEALKPEFELYQRQILKNAKVLADCLLDLGIDLVSGGTANHMVLLDLSRLKLGGAMVEKTLEEIGIVCNKNVIPNDKRKPMDPSGIRLGTPAVTSRGMGEVEMKQLAQLIATVIDKIKNNQDLDFGSEKELVKKMTTDFPLWY